MNVFKYALVVVWLCFSSQVMATDVTRTLNEAADLQLQKGLETLIEEQHLTAAVKAEELAVVLVIVTDPITSVLQNSTVATWYMQPVSPR